MNYAFLRSVKTYPDKTDSLLEIGRQTYQANRYRLRNLGLEMAYQMLNRVEPDLIHTVSFWQETGPINKMADNVDLRYEALAQQPIVSQTYATYKLIKAYAREHSEFKFTFLVVLKIDPLPADHTDYMGRILQHAVHIWQMANISSIWFGRNIKQADEYLGFISGSDENELRVLINTYAYPITEAVGPAVSLTITASNLNPPDEVPLEQ